MKTLLNTLALAALLGAAAFAADRDAEKLQAMAASAKTAQEHTEVAKQYRLAAEVHEKRAQKHEAEVAALDARPKLSLAGKWPSMMPKSAEKERALAMEAKRAAQECLRIADRHYRLALEAQHVAE